MKFLLSVSVWVLMHHHLLAQTTSAFRSAGSGNWSNPSTWEYLFENSWLPATNAPDSMALSTEIRSGDTVHLNGSIQLSRLLVTGMLLIESGADVILHQHQSVVHPGGIIVNKGMLRSTQMNLSFLERSVYRHQWKNAEGSIPIAQWHPDSSVEIQGFTSTPGASTVGNWSQTFGHVIWDTPELQNDFFLNGLLNSIQGNLTIRNTNGYVLRFTNNQSATVSIGGNLQVLDNARISTSKIGPNSSHVVVNIGNNFHFMSSAPSGSRICEQGTSVFNVGQDFSMDRGILYFSSGSGGTSSVGADLKVRGDVLFTGGTLDASVANSNRVGDLFFTGSSEQKFVAQGTIMGVFHYRLQPGSIVRVDGEQVMTGSTFECNGCTLKVGSTDPAGAIQKSATAGGNLRVRTQFWYPGSTIVYSGTSRQYLSSDHPQQSGINTVIDNPAGVETSATGSGIVLGGNLDILKGGLTILNNNLTIRGYVNTYGGGVAVSSVGLSSARTLTVDGDLLLTGSGERLRVESSATTNAANAVLALNGNFGGTGYINFVGPNAQVQIGGLPRTFRRPFPVQAPFVLEQLTYNVSGTSMSIQQPVTLGNYTVSTNAWTGGLFMQSGIIRMNAPLIVRSVVNLSGGILDFSGQEIELRRNIQTNWPVGVFAADRYSLVRVTSNFSGTDNTLAFLPGKDTLGTLILDRTANVQAVGGLPVTPHLRINSSLIISDLLYLKDGELYHQSGLGMLPNALLIRSADAAFSASTVVPPLGGPYRLWYSRGAAPRAVEAGWESGGLLKSLYTDLADTLLVRRRVVISDSLSVCSGTVVLRYDSLQSAR
ncbi:MAG: hypothetical protein ACO263_09690, partial [Cyclobacteriaceae bacterium]